MGNTGGAPVEETGVIRGRPPRGIGHPWAAVATRISRAYAPVSGNESLLSGVPAGDTSMTAAPDVVSAVPQSRFREQLPVGQFVEVGEVESLDAVVITHLGVRGLHAHA